MQSNIFNLDWENDFDYRDSEHRKNLAGAMQYFCAVPDKFVPKKFQKVQAFIKEREKIKKTQMQMFTLPTDFPADPTARQLVDRFLETAVYDNGYEQIFNVLNFAGSGKSSFEVLDVQSGLTFREVLPGEKLKTYAMSGDITTCHFAYYGGALGWFRGLFEDRNWVRIEENAIFFRNVAYRTRAAVFYALLEAVADAKSCCSAVPADCTDCQADSISIARSLNLAATTILRQVQNKGYGLTPGGTSFVVLTPPELAGRVRMALGVTNQHYSTSEKIINYNFIQITSLMPLNHNRVLVILPKNKLYAGYRMDLTLFDDFDMFSYTDTVAGWMRYGGCVGDTDQIQCIEFTPLSGSCPPSSE